MRPSSSYYGSSTSYGANNYNNNNSTTSHSSTASSRTSSQHLRSTLSSPSTSSYVNRTHLPFVAQSTLVAHCFTGVQSSTRPYVHYSSSPSSRPSSYVSARASLRPVLSHQSSLSSSRANSTNKRSTLTSSSSIDYGHYSPRNSPSESPSINYNYPRTSSSSQHSNSNSYLSSSSYSSSSPSSASSFRSTASHRPIPKITTSSSSYLSDRYRPIRLRERPVLNHIWRQLNDRSQTNLSSSSSYTGRAPYTPYKSVLKRDSDADREDQQSASRAEQEVEVDQSRKGTDRLDPSSAERIKPNEEQSNRQDEREWHSDLTRAISRNKYLIKFREFDRSVSPASVLADPIPESPKEPPSESLIENEVTSRPEVQSSDESVACEPETKKTSSESPQSEEVTQSNAIVDSESQILPIGIVSKRVRFATEQEPSDDEPSLEEQPELKLATESELPPIKQEQVQEMRLPLQEEQPKAEVAENLVKLLKTSPENSIDSPRSAKLLVNKKLAEPLTTDTEATIQIPTKLVAEAKARQEVIKSTGSDVIKKPSIVPGAKPKDEVKETKVIQPPIEVEKTQVGVNQAKEIDQTTKIQEKLPVASSQGTQPKTSVVLQGDQASKQPDDLVKSERDKSISSSSVAKSQPDSAERVEPADKTSKSDQQPEPVSSAPKSQAQAEQVPSSVADASTGEQSKEEVTKSGRPVKLKLKVVKKDSSKKEVGESSGDKSQKTPSTPESPTRPKKRLVKRRTSKTPSTPPSDESSLEQAVQGTSPVVVPVAETRDAPFPRLIPELPDDSTNSKPSEATSKQEVAKEDEDQEAAKLPSSELAVTTTITTQDQQSSGKIQVKKPDRIRFREYNIHDFNFLSVLGHGGWGFVILAELKQHDACFAVKCIKKITIVEDDDYESILIERKVLTLGNINPFICKLFCTFETPGYLFFVMEFCAGGDLMFHVQKEGKFSEPRCRFYAAEIICAIRFLHNRHIIYRDLKLDNILLDSSGHIRLVDFGMCQCRTYREEMLPSNFCGTPEYISPEIIKGVPYNHSVDWWSFGVLLYEMAVGKMPFRGNDENELLWNVCYEQIHYPLFLSRELTVLLQQLLEREPSKRMGMATCKSGDIKDQAWFKGTDWQEIGAMKTKPPFVPCVQSKRDVQNFDADFTESRPELSPVDEATLERIDQKQFQKFPYTNPDIHIFEP